MSRKTDWHGRRRRRRRHLLLPLNRLNLSLDLRLTVSISLALTLHFISIRTALTENTIQPKSWLEMLLKCYFWCLDWTQTETQNWCQKADQNSIEDRPKKLTENLTEATKNVVRILEKFNQKLSRNSPKFNQNLTKKCNRNSFNNLTKISQNVAKVLKNPIKNSSSNQNSPKFNQKCNQNLTKKCDRNFFNSLTKIHQNLTKIPQNVVDSNQKLNRNSLKLLSKSWSKFDWKLTKNSIENSPKKLTKNLIKALKNETRIIEKSSQKLDQNSPKSNQKMQPVDQNSPKINRKSSQNSPNFEPKNTAKIPSIIWPKFPKTKNPIINSTEIHQNSTKNVTKIQPKTHWKFQSFPIFISFQLSSNFKTQILAKLSKNMTKKTLLQCYQNTTNVETHQNNYQRCNAVNDQ